MRYYIVSINSAKLKNITKTSCVAAQNQFDLYYHYDFMNLEEEVRNQIRKELNKSGVVDFENSPEYMNLEVFYEEINEDRFGFRSIIN